MGNNKSHSTGVPGMLVLVIIAIVAACSASGYGLTIDDEGLKVGRPEDFARATGAARAADLAITATSQAMSATATAGSQIANATATAVPWQAPRAAAAANTEIANRYTLSAALLTGVIIAALFGSAAVTWMRVRAKVVRPGPTGQMPLLVQGNTSTDHNRAIGSSVTVPSSPGALWTIHRAWHWLKTGQILPLPESRVLLADGGANADHYLEAARVAGTVGVAAAMFRPDNAQRGRQDKIELLRREGDKGLLSMRSGAPQTRVIVGDSAIEQIAKQLGDRLPLPTLVSVTTTNPPAPNGVEAGKQVIEGKAE